MTAAAKSNGISSGRVQQIIRDLQWTMLLPEIMGADTYKVPDIKTRDHVASVREHADFWLRKLEVLRAHVNSTKDTELTRASLIAAAPELLEVAQAARAQIALERDVFVDCNAYPDGSLLQADKATLDGMNELLARMDAAIAKATGEKI